MRLSTLMKVTLLATALAGCASPLSFSPGTSIVEVRAKSGTPTDIRFDRNDDELWEYATGPAGYETYLVRFSIDGKVKDVAQLLTDDQLEKIVPGKMNKADVRNLLGRPTDETFTANAGTVWSWRFRRFGTAPGWLTVRFSPDNTVFERIAILDITGGRMMEGR